ncbi:MAG: TIGR02677 family protein [Lachnospiraceae bacterium]|nr:TIGR02677 family protein [Lachnospiraceae bacterium]
MKIHDKLIKPVREAKYLDVENTDRYRSIVRLFYLNYEKLKYWMYQEEVYEELREDFYFADYTMEQCQQDLSVLKEWGNLATIQDTRKVSTIEEFKNKKFRYQLTETAVEVERMIIRLENLFIEGSSLEPTLLERLRQSLTRLDTISGESRETIYGWWNDLSNDFIRLNQNYQDYMRELNSVKAEEMMKTREFLVFKDRLIEYLHAFVKSLQLNVTAIEQSIKNVKPEIIQKILDEVTAYEMSIPRMDVEVNEQQIYERLKGRFENIQRWFAGADGAESEAAKVFDTTNEIIRKITRYASRLSEQNSSGANRREEYRKLAGMFARIRDIDEAHKLSAVVFGMEKPLHIKGDFARETESINSGVFEEKPQVITVAPRVRNYKEKAKRSTIQDRTKEKEEVRRAMIAAIEEEKRLISNYIKDGMLEFATLPEITPQVRDVFLTWLSKGLENPSHRAKTEDGKSYQIKRNDPESTCTLTCTDGTFRMPAYCIIFEDDKEGKG